MEDMKKNKKLRMTSIGHSEVHVNDVGNPYLHSKHQVGIEKFDKSNVGRAIVFDQHLIDVLYISNHFNEQQHSVCNKYLSMVVKGMHLSNPSFGSEKISTGKYYLSPLPRSCILIKVQRHIRKTCGRKTESRFWILMAKSPKRIREDDIGLMQECAESLLWFYDISDSPALLFERALLNPI